MSHTFQANDGTRVHYNSDLSGSAPVQSGQDDLPVEVDLADLRKFVDARLEGEAAEVPSPGSAAVPEQAWREFAASALRSKLVSKVEQAGDDTALGLKIEFPDRS